jgi:hypothetical protein
MALLRPTHGQGAAAGDALDRQIFQAFVDARYDDAARLIEQFLKDSPDDVQMLYNGACAWSHLGDLDKAADYLLRAVKSGFIDFEHMEQDPDLAALRSHDVYKAIVEARDRVARERSSERRSSANPDLLERWRELYGDEEYRYERDESRNLVYAVALDEVAYRQMREMIEREADYLIANFFGSWPEYTVLIAIPTPAHANSILKDPRIGGLYEHGKRRLVARDIGNTLRHELVHLLHYGQMERLKQQHPLWLQEGLAALFEDYRWELDGSITFLVNERHNIARHNARTGVSLPWHELFAFSSAAFMKQGTRLYPQVRAIFQFLAEREQLHPWYRSYLDNFKDDATGRKAFETIFNAPLSDIEREWRRWLAATEPIDTTIRPGDASLGIESALDSSNDGVAVGRLVAGGAAARAGLKRGDVIVAIDDTPTPSFSELTATVAAMRVGQQVNVRFRRNGEYATVVVTLRALRD